MTGYGQASGTAGSVQVRVEIKTLNGRYLDLKVRLPRELSALEPAVCKRLEERLHRGRVDVFFSMVSQSNEQFEINQPLAENYLKAAERARELGAEGKLEVSSLLALPGVLVPREEDFQAPEIESRLLAIVDRALKQVLQGREMEGRSLRQDLEQRLAALEGTIDRIEPRGAEFTEYYRRKLEERTASMMAQEAAVDSARMAQEIIYYSEKADISEEITRLRAHLERFRRILREADGSVGKNLDFLCQELNRETNTIVSKSPSPEISSLGVEAKVEIEKIREQVQNVE